MEAILSTVMKLVALGIDVAPYLTQLAAAFKKGAPPPTAAKLDEYRREEAAMSAQIQKSLPPELP